MSSLQASVCPGDILVFDAGDDWIGKSIAWLTNSNVSHAAMMYGENTVVEMGLSGISVSTIAEDPKGERVHILRLSPDRNPQPLVNAAEIYVNNQVKYDLPSLVLLAGLLIYREIRPTPKLKIITDTILRLACAEVDKMIERLRKDHRKTMVCSQLVYQCYLDCGKDYHIRISNGDLQAFAASNSVEPQKIRLIDHLEETNKTDQVMVGSVEVPALLPEEAAKELYAALQNSDENLAQIDFAVNFQGVLQLAKELLEKLEQFLEGYGADLPVQALFITPGDLLNHSVNLAKIGEFTIERI